MAACSSHFEQLFNGTGPVTGPVSHNQFFVILDQTRADDLSVLLHFMYRGEAYLQTDRVDSLLRTADALQVKGLMGETVRDELNNTESPQPPPPPQQQQQHRPYSPEPDGHVPRSSGVGIMGNIKRKQQDPHPRDYANNHFAERGMHYSRSLDRADSLDRQPQQPHTVHHRGPPMARPMSPDNGGMSPPPYGPGYSAAPRDHLQNIYQGAGGVFARAGRQFFQELNTQYHH